MPLMVEPPLLAGRPGRGEQFTRAGPACQSSGAILRAMSILGSLTVKLGLDPSQFQAGLLRARATLSLFKSSVSDSDASTGRFAKTVEKLGSAAADKAKELAKFAISAGAVASTALSAAPLLIKAAQGIVQFGSAALQASPMLLGIGAAGLYVKSVITALVPALKKSFDPFVAALGTARDNAARLATAGLSPLIARFTALNMPAISASMRQIATDTNGVVKQTLAWANSTAGVMAIRNVVQSAADAFSYLSPHIDRVVISFGNMLGRITAVSTAAGAAGLSGVLDRLAGWLDRVNAATVSSGLDKLKSDYEAVKNVITGAVEWIKKATQFWNEHRQAIKLVEDALSVLAIAFGGPAVAVAAATGIIIRHWDEIKSAWQSLNDYFTGNQGGVSAASSLSNAWETVKPGLLAFWDEIKSKVGPVVSDIWDKIKNKLIPAVSDLIDAIAPFARAWLDAFGPTIVAVIQGIGQAVSGLVDVVSGGINVVSGILSGNWSRAWDGAKQMVSGSGQIIEGSWNATAGNVIDTAQRMANGVNGNLGQIPRQINTNLTATDNASAVADQVRLRMSYIPSSVTTVITAISRTVQGNALGGINTMARGGVLGMAPGGALSPMSGNMASIVAPNTWRVIGDRMQGAEAFIPLNKSARSIAILTEAAKRMGFAIAAQGSPSIAMPSGANGAIDLPTPRGVAAVRSGAGSQPIVIEFRGGQPLDTALLQAMRKAVRDNGGTSDRAFARGVR